MGVFELHLHEPNVTLNTGGESPQLDWGRTDGGEERPPITGKLGPVLILLAVIVLAVLRNRRRE
ncbi:hypothetical protein [Haladaptatus caseinilyticus]|uniref:hypothetical protein n=1 Tax=Haladaptatus caseinilyticus TaxID=2993314 RepID=UPI00224AB824|nr:hypothetical protein [Haladaptatus caseinilyticus]